LTRIDVGDAVLFVFAHQDDEVAALPWLDEERRRGSRVACVYLTDGATRTAANIRDGETRAVLLAAGIRADDIAFLDDGERIRDNQLFRAIPRARAMLESWIAANMADVCRIYSLAWEGGHPDHDAAHVVAFLIASGLGIASQSWQFSLYNAAGCPRRLFRVLHPLRSASRSRTISYSLGSAVRYALACWKYSSQVRTWAGLFPELLVRRVLLRRESVAQFDARRILARPHEGPLLYETYFATSYDELSAAIATEREEIAASL